MVSYPEMKDSGIDWIGKIPKDWDKLPLYRVSSENKVKNLDKNENVLSLSYGRIIRRDLSKNFGLLPENFNNYQIVNEGYIIIRSTDLQNDKRSLRVGLVNEFGVITSAYIGLIPNQKMHPEYLFQYLYVCDIKKVFYSLGSGVRQNLNFKEFKKLPLIVPPLEEQTKIANYLDKKTNQIDTLVEKIEKKIELLNEQRTSLINQCVTKGLNPNVEMKDGGVEWVGKIPKHWKIKKLKYISTYSVSSIDRHIINNENHVEICHYPNVYNYERINSKTDFSKGSCNDNELEKYKIRKGDIIITKDSESPKDIGIPSYVNDNLNNVVCGYHLGIIRPKSNISSNYLFRYFQSNLAKSHFYCSSKGITRFGLGKSKVINLKAFIPPTEEQTKIADFLDKKTNQIDTLIKSEKKKVKLLKEYRQSLISSVVTGKVDVRQLN